MTPRPKLSVRRAQYSLLEVFLPGRPPVAAGVLLLDPVGNELRARFRGDWSGLAEAEDAEVLELLESDLNRRGMEVGGEAALAELEDRLSNVLRISPRRALTVRDAAQALERLYRRYVEGAAEEETPAQMPVRVPIYSLRAAATRFGEDMEVEPEGFVRAPEGQRRADRLFAAHVVGQSMEPLIPDGSLCLFRYPVEGSRQGKLLLIWRRGASAAGGEFTIKRYSSVKSVNQDRWRHERIRLEPLNPEFEAWDLDPSELDSEDSPYRVCGEFLQVIPYEEQ